VSCRADARAADGSAGEGNVPLHEVAALAGLDVERTAEVHGAGMELGDVGLGRCTADVGTIVGDGEDQLISRDPHGDLDLGRGGADTGVVSATTRTQPAPGLGVPAKSWSLRSDCVG
jgi:hypothetical protein